MAQQRGDVRLAAAERREGLEGVAGAAAGEHLVAEVVPGARVEHAALLDTLFGGDTRPDPRMRLRPLFPEREDALLTRLPLPFFVWGLESI